MVFSGDIVGAGVGVIMVGVTVGGTGVIDGTVVAVAGTEVGRLVTEMGVPDVAHPTRTRTSKPKNNS
jgi:hypothetical protein